MKNDALRPDRFTARYKIDLHPMIRAEFCQQVGDYDVWITPNEVLMVRPPSRGTDISKYEAYTYEHAGQRFPLIEHKIKAMRAMIFGAN